MDKIQDNIKTLLNLFDNKKFDEVIIKSKKLIRKFPNYLILYNILGSSYQNTGRFNLARDIFIKANKMDASNIAIMNNLANVHKNIGEMELSENLFQKIIKKNPNYTNAYINWGNLKRDSNDFESAINLYNKAYKIDEKNPVVLYSLALAYQGLGDFKLAINFAKKTLQIDKKFTQADMLISQSQKYEQNNDHYLEMKLKIKDLELNDVQKTNLLFAMSKAEEDMDLIKESFTNLNLANYTWRKLLNFNINNEIKIFNKIKSIFNKIDLTKTDNFNFQGKKLIFILGMPRSGTSLVEQIITSHSDVFGAGEIPQLSKIIKNKLFYEDLPSEDSLIDLFQNESFADQLRLEYYNYLKRFNAKNPFITDKAPLNFRWIGIIKILFPNSKIIHCSRNSKDNCLSIFKNFFEAGLDFGYNQKELGTYYNIYLDLIKFWQKKLPGLIYEAKYEHIIQSPELEIKKIIKFCDLHWEENCLEFHRNKTPIKTMSTAQARKPIYKSSLNSFEKFSPFLNDLNKLL